MAKFASRVKETTTSTGTGTINLAGAVSGFRIFLGPANISDQDYVPYFLLDANGTAWEEGYGKVIAGTPNQLERGFVMDSSNAGAAINLSAGTHTVGIGPIADTRKHHGALVSISTTFSVPDNILTVIDFDTVEYDTDNLFSVSNRMTVPDWVSIIRVVSSLTFTANSVGIRQDRFLKNGAGASGLGNISVGALSVGKTFLNASGGDLEVVAGDFLQVAGFQNSGGALNVDSDSWFSFTVIE